MVRMGGIELMAEDLGRDPAMRGQAIEPRNEGQRDPLVRYSPGEFALR